MQKIDWQELLNEATDTERVASICNEFLRTWSAADIARIPASCHPPTTITVDQVGPYAIKLIAEIGVGNRSTAPLLYAMSTFFTKAALRLAELAGPANHSTTRVPFMPGCNVQM